MSGYIPTSEKTLYASEFLNWLTEVIDEHVLNTPSAEEWIPTSERNPDEDVVHSEVEYRTFLVTCKIENFDWYDADNDKVYYSPSRIVTTAVYAGVGSWECLGTVLTSKEVLAWKPFPTPYDGEKGEDE